MIFFRAGGTTAKGFGADIAAAWCSCVMVGGRGVSRAVGREGGWGGWLMTMRMWEAKAGLICEASAYVSRTSLIDDKTRGSG